uniref:Uncharacterized protein n=1 Tax=Eutreptiella gymnastica TaxID=73025 RepID=A0A7S1NBA7_9EUGL|mmetsp:Transcript_149394/g.260949  ORF Transcript_149394/g.260949 Transcript_149394/m.260949 type:complete len:327 (+) Transcript_149394:1-981(+)
MLLMCAVVLAGFTTECQQTRTYVPSLLEQHWSTNIHRWTDNTKNWTKGCNAYREDKSYIDKWKSWMRCERLSSKDKSTHGECGYSQDTFSYHEVRSSCNSSEVKREYLEPLAVALRHPEVPCDLVGRGKDKTGDTNWIVFPQWSNRRARRSYFFDLGSTTYTAGMFGHRDSLAWFVQRFRQKGTEFDEIFAWEKNTINALRYWKKVPNDMVAKMHFYNVATTTDPHDSQNALRIVEEVARPEDFVVFKLDIDSNHIEQLIVQQLIDSPKLQGLVDELFWEHHVSLSPMQWYGWGDASRFPNTGTIMDSYRNFTKLRQLGIRAHSWV